MKGDIMMKSVFYLCVVLVIVTMAGCTTNRVEYALASTTEAGVFYPVKKPNSSAEVAVQIQEKLKPSTDDQNIGQKVAIDYTKYALVIGIQDYKQQASVNYADNSARLFASTLKNVLGVPEEHILFLENENATSGQIKTNIMTLKELADSGDSLYFFFAGHGVPGRDGNTYLLPSDMGADSIHLEPQLNLDQVYSTLSSSNAKRVYAFVDSCFSGKNDEGQLVYRGVAPIFKKKDRQFSSKKLSVMTAGSSTEFANQYEKEKQRLFSYFLVKGLTKQKDNISELYSYVRRNVKRESLRIGLGYKQVPTLQMAN